MSGNTTRIAPYLLSSCKGALLAASVAVFCGGYVAAHDPIGTKVTWDREIAPIVQARCVSCHAEGGKAPMALTTYEQVRPWARAIREEVLARRMPKWAAVRGYGDFLNDRSLSAFEIALIAAWVDGGAPKTLPRPSRPLAVPPLRTAFVPPKTREIDVPCDTRTLPPGRLLGVRPQLPAGPLRVITDNVTTGPEPLLWIDDYDPDFPDTYWLRTPIAAGRATHRIVTSPSKDCRLVLLYSVTR